jgi:hypothetical protein
VDLHQLTLKGELNTIDPNKFTQKRLTQKGMYGDSVFNMAAYLGYLKHIPQKFLTPENLMIPDNYGNRGIDEAIKRDNLNQIPYTTLVKLKNNCPEKDLIRYERALTEAKEKYLNELKQKIGEVVNKAKQP